VFLGDGGFDEFIGEGGDDIMVGSAGRGKMAGMSGFDWATYKDGALGIAGVNADLSIPIIFDEAPQIPGNAALDEYQSVEGLSGSAGDDILRGSNILGEERLPFDPLTNPVPLEGYQGSALDAAGIALIDGLDDVVGAGVTSFIDGDIILGGAGNDVMAGQAGDDILDGDKWLNVRISVRENADGTGAEIDSADSMTELAAEMFNGTYNPGQLQIVREIVDESGDGFTDIAVFSDVRANYLITNNPNGTVTVTHVTVSDGLESDGTDTLHNMERLRFSDIEIALNAPATGTPTLNDTTPTEGQSITVSTAGILDENGLGAFAYQWQSSTDGVTWTDIAGATNQSFTPDDNAGTTAGDHAGLLLRARVQFTDGGGTLETLFSAATSPVGQNWDAILTGGATFNGNNGDDIAAGSLVNDTLNGAGGNDNLNGRTGSDTITGGAGNDTIEGGGIFGTDVSVYAGAATNFSVEGGTVGAIQIIDGTGAEGTDTVSGVETLRFNGVNYTVVNGSNGTNANLNGAAGAANSQAVFGFGGTDSLNGGAGNDILHGGDGTDTITQTGSTGGRDVVNGGAGNDTFVLNGVAGAETFRIYTRAEAIAAGMTIVNTNTEIVVTRNGTTNAEIIAELDNIEEININSTNVTTTPPPANAGGDTVMVIGDFTGTSLNFNTITIDGNSGDDTIDISSLDSAHRIVFRSNGGNDTLIGALRPQDVIELPEGSLPGDYEVTENDDGTTTLANATNSITYSGDGAPEVRASTPGANEENGTPAVPGIGTPNSDVLIGTEDDDNIVAFAGEDVAMGNGGADAISAGEGGDFVSGGAGRDVIFAGAGDDQVLAGADNDIVYGDAGADRIFGDQGNDMITAGAGDDAVFGGAGDDLIVAEVGDGNDVYFGDEGGGGNGIDTLDVSAATANVTVNLGSGALSNGTASSSQTGNDTIWGIENVNTGSGNDTITASNAVNVMNGGAGNDTFKFTSTAAANGDTIVTFEPGDRIDLTAIDANIGAAGDQSFTLVNGAPAAAGQLGVTFESRAEGDVTVVQGNIDGNADADFTIEIAGHHNLSNANLGL
jgi:Ca2+-binding RTX toxin-like protein